MSRRPEAFSRAAMAGAIAGLVLLFSCSSGGQAPETAAATATATPATATTQTADLAPEDAELLRELAETQPSDTVASVQVVEELSSIELLPATADLEQIRAVLGPPDAFNLTFEDDPAGNGAPPLRVETWTFFALDTAFVFQNGELRNSYPVEPLPDLAILPRQYDPGGFRRDMALSEAAELIGDPEAALISEFSEDEMGAELKVYASEQILLMFDAAGLIAVETFPLVAGAGG